MLVLGIESTCDETGCAVVRDGDRILSNVIASQSDLHSKYGGVLPELASRRHIDVIIPTIDEAVNQAGVKLSDIDLIAVAHGPGLIGPLLIGLNTAKALALSLDKPFIGINHIEAHLYAALMSHDSHVSFPCFGVVLSGGHTTLAKIHNIGQYETIGYTVDDAVGEAFDKVAKILGLPYPGGPHIEKLAKEGDRNRFSLKAGQVKGRPFHFSFSGLKTGVLYKVKGQNGQMNDALELSRSDKCDMAASFQKTAFIDIIHKTLTAADKYQCKTILFGGGVTNNECLRQMFSQAAPTHNLLWPIKTLTLDNAAMIAGLGYHRYKLQGSGDTYYLEPATRIRL